jgi:hypothetical protein
MAITHEEFLDRVIDEGIVAARRDYSRPDQKDKLEGSIAGFEACRGKSVLELKDLLDEANKSADASAHREDARYWYFRCQAAEIEWCCNCVSAVLYNEGRPVIIQPTANAVMQVARIVGVRNA